jgi:hypothetical protein
MGIKDKVKQMHTLHIVQLRLHTLNKFHAFYTIENASLLHSRPFAAASALSCCLFTQPDLCPASGKIAESRFATTLNCAFLVFGSDLADWASSFLRWKS